jgi:hypothetical protein
MKEGYWFNYETGKIFLINEHEMWIRLVANARKLGLPEQVIAGFSKFTPTTDRDRFLSHLFRVAPIMRVRGHGAFVTFEFFARRETKPLEAIRRWARKNAGPSLTLNIINHARKVNVQVLYEDFLRQFKAGSPKPASSKVGRRVPSPPKQATA